MFRRKPPEPKEPANWWEGDDNPFKEEIKAEKKKMREPRHRALGKIVTSTLKRAGYTQAVIDRYGNVATPGYKIGLVHSTEVVIWVTYVGPECSTHFNKLFTALRSEFGRVIGKERAESLVEQTFQGTPNEGIRVVAPSDALLTVLFARLAR